MPINELLYTMISQALTTVAYVCVCVCYQTFRVTSLVHYQCYIISP